MERRANSELFHHGFRILKSSVHGLGAEVMSRYHVIRSGTGQPLLFLPGGGFTGNQGILFQERLMHQFDVHLLDLPGFGQSAGLTNAATSRELADWVEGYRVEVGLEKVHLIGHSLGGAICLAYAVHYPARVSTLILLDEGHKPFPHVPFREYGLVGLSIPFLRVMYRMLPKTVLHALERRVYRLLPEPVIDDVLFKAFCHKIGIEERKDARLAFMSQARLTTGGVHLLFGYARLSVTRLLRRVTVPTLLCYGDFTGVDLGEARRSLRAIERAERLNPDVTYIAVPGGHFVHWSRFFPFERVHSFLQSGINKK